MREGKVFLAVDLGPALGRVMAGRFDGKHLALEEAHRFSVVADRVGDSPRWDIPRLLGEIKDGLAKAGALYGSKVVSIGVDAWGEDYGLIDAHGALLNPPFAYRDPSHVGMQAEAFAMVPRDQVYEITGLQPEDTNTVFQLLAEAKSGAGSLEKAHGILFIPDLVNHWLTGVAKNEYTISSTGQLLDARRRVWADTLIGRLGLPTRLFGDLVTPGATLGVLLPEVAEGTGLGGCEVVAVGSHRAAGAVAAVPFEGEGSAYLLSGARSFMGIETGEPIINARSMAYGMTNEGGVCDTIRVLKCIPGPAAPESTAGIVRVGQESLAFRYRAVLEQLEDLAGHRLEVLHIVGRGAENKRLNQLAANVLGRSVEAGPVEAAPAGNVLMQMLAAGEVASLQEGRDLVRASFGIERYAPRDVAAWEEAYKRARPHVAAAISPPTT